MSFNRENIAWQGQDGKWSIGFYECFEVNQDDDDFDPEYSVEYDFSRFEWAATGVATMKAAFNAYRGANPGHHSVLEWSDKSKAEIAKLDSMAAEYFARSPRPRHR